MRLLQAPTQTYELTPASSTPEARLHGRWLLFARVTWLLIAALALGIYVATIPAYFAVLHVPCTSGCMYKQITPNGLRELQEWGLSLDFFATYWIAVYIVFTGVYATIGAVIFWRKSDDRMALFASFTLVTFPAAFNYAELATLPSAWWLPCHIVDFLGSISLGLFFYLFPTGQFVPRWTRWLWVASILFLVVQGFLPSSLNFRSPVPTLSGVVFLGFICSMLGAQIYRYRYVSNAVQRQQTKWVVFGISIGLGSFLLLVVLTRFFPSLIPPGLLAFLILDTAFSLALLLFPLSIGIAILRSHLFDIDLIINRTLVYGTLTSMLAIVYVGLIMLLQNLVNAFASQSSPSQPVVVVSTLAIVALFQPLRKNIQTIIDRRFYRSKYRAKQILQTFSSTLRNEMDLNHLQEELLQTVYETIQPAHVSLWLCEVDATSLPYGNPTHGIENNTCTLDHNANAGAGVIAADRAGPYPARIPNPSGARHTVYSVIGLGQPFGSPRP